MKPSRLYHLIYHLLLLFCVTAFAQTPQTDFTQLDSITRTKKYRGDLPLLVSQLTQNCITQTEKARAIFVWIADNIAYDYKAFNKHKLPKRLKPKKGKNYNDIVAQWKIDYTDRVLRKGKGVCEGYAMLFKRMCDYAGLQTDYVPGYIKKSPREIGRMGTLDHAWNGIILDGKYYYLDVTWAAGYCDKNKKGKLNKFNKYLNNFYWLTPIEKFCMEHYPEDEKSPGVAEYSKERYKNNPFAYGYYLLDTEIISPQSGVIEAHVGDTIHFEIKNKAFAINIQYSTNTDLHPFLTKESRDGNYRAIEESDEKHSLNIKRTGDIYAFDYIVESDRLRTIELYNFNMRAYVFKVKIIK